MGCGCLAAVPVAGCMLGDVACSWLPGTWCEKQPGRQASVARRAACQFRTAPPPLPALPQVAPVMGAGYHTIHHTLYNYNYGHYFTFVDRLVGAASCGSLLWELTVRVGCGSGRSQIAGHG